MFKVIKNINLSRYSSMHIGGKAAAFAVISKEEEILEALKEARRLGLPLHILGGGSNTIFKGAELKALVCKMELKGIALESEDSGSALLRIAAGERWDDCVAFAVKRGLSGIEALSAIPGTAGATPVQNVGAYGQEIADTLVELRAFDMQTNAFVTILKKDCDFSYRKSMFNSSQRGRYIIVSIRLKVSKLPAQIPDYPGVAKYFEEKGISNPTLLQIREAIISIRASKLPDPSVIPNAGSFFKNPIISQKFYETLKKKYQTAPSFATATAGEVKIPAGWLIEQSGLKGRAFGPITVYEKNAVVLTNPGNGNWENLEAARMEIVRIVKEKFGVKLEREPEVI